jgi:ABC-2 type transport system permease protein
MSCTGCSDQLRHDAALVFLTVYAFTSAIYAPARQASTEVQNAAVAIVDEDGSPLSRRICDALLPPRFLPPASLTVQEIDAGMDIGRYTFSIDIPPDFQANVVQGPRPAIQLNVDAGAMTQAGTGAGYIQSIIAQELTAFL